jgi:hypothetical protein
MKTTKRNKSGTDKPKRFKTMGKGGSGELRKDIKKPFDIAIR